MNILNYQFEASSNCVLVVVDEWPEPIRINIDGMSEAPTLSAIGRMVKATIDRKRREAAVLARETAAKAKAGPLIPAGRHEARNFR